MDQFQARTASEIKQHIEEGIVAPYMNVFMAKPLCVDNQLGFCLNTYNRFNYNDCLTRWNFVKDIFKLEGSQKRKKQSVCK